MNVIRTSLGALAIGVAVTLAPDALAADHVIEMRNQGEAGTMVFEPRILHVEPGDTVRFVAADRGHSTESIDGMVPAGGPTWEGAVDEEIEVTLDVEGVYGVLCRPHYAMGMVALIVVGDDAHNLEEAKQVDHPAQAGDAFKELFAELEASL